MKAFAFLMPVLLFSSQVFACSTEAVKPPREVSVEYGIGGSCYYKRIPLDSSDESWRTEFYLDEGDTKPFYTLEGWFPYSVLCIGEGDTKHIAHVQSLDGYVSPDVNETSWLDFYVDSKLVKSYSPIEVIKEEDNVEETNNCGVQYLAEEFGFVFDESLDQYVYRVETSDNRIVNFDPATGRMLE